MLELTSDAILEKVLTVCKFHKAAKTISHELRPLQFSTRAMLEYKRRKKDSGKQD